MNKVAILVIGANAPKILGRVLHHFDDPRFKFFLHVDAKLDLEAYSKELGDLDRVHLVEPRIAVFWGGFSMIEAELALIRSALADEQIDRLVLWSDDTVPLRSPETVYQSLTEAPDRIARDVHQHIQGWYHRFYFADSQFSRYLKDNPESRHFEPADWENVQRMQRLVERGKKKLDRIYFSRQWWALSRKSATAILQAVDEDEHLVESFRFSLFPDETFFSTSYRLCFPKAVVPDVPMFADYERLPVPAVYAHARELPKLKLLPERYLFMRKIWPWSTALVDRIASDWLPKIPKLPPSAPLHHAAIRDATLADPEVAAEKLSDQDEYERSLAAAIDAREDGEVEESAALFDVTWNSYPRTAQLALEYTHTLKKLRRYDEASDILDAAMELYPDDAKLRHIWADLAGAEMDHDEVIRRCEIYRAAFPPAQYPGAWHSLGMQFGSFSESLRWDDMRQSIQAHYDGATRFPHAFRICMWQATELCLTDEQKAMVDGAQPEAWAQLPPEAKGNFRLRLEMTELNRKLTTAAEARVISIGQNCLPYLLGGRWGLIARRECPEAMTPFDRGAYQKDNAAEVIASGFATFLDRGAFSETRSYDGARMFKHDDTGIYFFHERGEFWMRDGGDKFFAHLERLISNWRQVSTFGRRLFVFCLCGEGDLETLVDVMDGGLLGPDSHLLVIDVLQHHHECPAHQHVTYLHLPYPANYAWDNFIHQAAARGVGFELGVVNAIFDLLVLFVAEDKATWFREQRRKLLRDAAAASVRWKRGHDNGVALHAALRQVEPASVASAITYARVLRDNGKIDEAGQILAREKERFPANYEVGSAWADLGVAPFDWSQKLIRLRTLREAFPPEAEPRSLGNLIQEVNTLTEHGEWPEAMELIDSYWSYLVTKADLFQAALGTSVRLGHLDTARRLFDEATEPVRLALPTQMAGAVERRLGEAQANRATVRRSGMRIIPLGQNSFPTMLVTRWGLNTRPRAVDEASPFELGDFYKDTAAEAIADDFEGLSDLHSYVEKAAWGGGKVLRHSATGVAFMAHRSAQIGPAEKQRFFAHLDQMISYWRQIRSDGRRVFVYFHTDTGDLNRLVAVVKEKLLGPEAKLVVIDQNVEPTPVPEDKDVILMHAPPPKNYPWFDALGSATPESMEYEQRVLAPVIEIVKQMGLVAEEVSAMSDP